MKTARDEGVLHGDPRRLAVVAHGTHVERIQRVVAGSCPVRILESYICNERVVGVRRVVARVEQEVKRHDQSSGGFDGSVQRRHCARCFSRAQVGELYAAGRKDGVAVAKRCFG